RVAEATAAAEEARAIQKLADKVDAGGAAAYLVAKALKGLGGAGAAASTSTLIQRPPGLLEASQEARAWIRDAGGLLLPAYQIREQGKTTRAGYDRDVRVEDSRQGGETSRIQSVAGIAAAVAANQPSPNVTTTYTPSGAGVIG